MSGCCGDSHALTATYTVKGMSCHHCVGKVEKAVKAVNGVKDARVNLDSGELTVTYEPQVSRDDIAAAVKEAGYELV